MDLFQEALEIKEYNTSIKKYLSVEEKFFICKNSYFVHMRLEIGHRELYELENIFNIFKEGDEDVVLKNYLKRQNGEEVEYFFKEKIKDYQIKNCYQFLNTKDKKLLFKNILNRPKLPKTLKENPEVTIERFFDRYDDKIKRYKPIIRKEILKVIAERYYNNFYNDLEFFLNLRIDEYTKKGIKLISDTTKLAKERNMSLEEFEKNILKLNFKESKWKKIFNL